MADYIPYKGLVSLQNVEPPVGTGFNWEGYKGYLAKRFTIVDKGIEGARPPMEVPFVQQPAQVDFLYYMSLYYNLLILKARKMGFSSTSLGVASGKFITGRNEKCVTMSFDQSAADKQLARAKHFIRSYERIKSQQEQREVKIPLKYNSKSEMVWEGRDKETGETWVNTLRVGTARVDSFGRGDDITYLHLTEVSLANDIKSLLAGVGEACIHGAHKILETTANGFNSYKTEWDESVLNQTGYAALFYSPEWEYDQEYLARKSKELGRLYDQEYPATPELAFLTSGNPYFDNDAMRHYLENTKEPLSVS